MCMLRHKKHRLWSAYSEASLTLTTFFTRVKMRHRRASKRRKVPHRRKCMRLGRKLCDWFVKMKWWAMKSLPCKSFACKPMCANHCSNLQVLEIITWAELSIRFWVATPCRSLFRALEAPIRQALTKSRLMECMSVDSCTLRLRR